MKLKTEHLLRDLSKNCNKSPVLELMRSRMILKRPCLPFRWVKKPKHFMKSNSNATVLSKLQVRMILSPNFHRRLHSCKMLTYSGQSQNLHDWSTKRARCRVQENMKRAKIFTLRDPLARETFQHLSARFLLRWKTKVLDVVIVLLQLGTILVNRASRRTKGKKRDSVAEKDSLIFWSGTMCRVLAYMRQSHKLVSGLLKAPKCPRLIVTP
jgi:hypothetical protein